MTKEQHGPMTPGTLLLRCACGWETTGSEEELIRATEEHGRRVHNMVPTRDEILAMIVRTDAPPSHGSKG
jgi:predicted small metal-binding protein